MDALLKLTNNELKQIFLLNQPFSPRVARLIQQEFKDAGTTDPTALYILRDEAFGHYWARVIDEKDALDDHLVRKLLECNEFPTSQSMLGGAIIEGKISPTQCKFILEKIVDKSWLYRQVKAFLFVSETSGSSLVSNLEYLLQLRCPWVLNRVVENIEIELLDGFSEKLEMSNSVSKKDKNRLNNKIQARKKHYSN